jgi:hypothetical protein
VDRLHERRELRREPAVDLDERRRFAGSADGYSKRSKLFVPGYFTESVTPITVTAPRWEKPSSVTSSPWRTSSAR